MATLGFGNAAWFVSLCLCASGAVAFDLSYQPQAAEEFDKWLAETAKPGDQKEVPKTVRDALQSLVDWRRGRMDFGFLCLKKAVELKDKGALPEIEAILENGREGGVEDRVCNELLGPATQAWILLKADGDAKEQARLAMGCFIEKHFPFLYPETCAQYLEKDLQTARPLLLEYATRGEARIDERLRDDVWRIAVLFHLFSEGTLSLTRAEEDAIMAGANMNARCALAKAFAVRGDLRAVDYVKRGLVSPNSDVREYSRAFIAILKGQPERLAQLSDELIALADRISVPNKEDAAVEERQKIVTDLARLYQVPKVRAFFEKDLRTFRQLKFVDCPSSTWDAIGRMWATEEGALRKWVEEQRK